MMTDINLNAVLSDLGKFKPTGQPEVDKRTVAYLTSLTKGANPEIPEVMALAQLQAFQKAMSQKPTAAPPQGTVRDKLAQSAGIMALKGAQQQQAPNPAPQGMPVPAGIPQPQMQAQPPAEEMPTEEAPQTVMAAQGGLMRARVDPRMFEFTHGGIVAFSGKDDDQEVTELGKEKSLSKEERARLENELAMRLIGEEARAKEQAATPSAPPPSERESEMMRAVKTPFRAIGEGISKLYSGKPSGPTPQVDSSASGDLGAAIMAEPTAAPAGRAPQAPRPVSSGPSSLGPAQEEYIRLIKQGMPPEMAEKVMRASMGAGQSGIAGAPGAAGPAAPRPPAGPARPAGPTVAPPSMAQGVGALAKDLMPPNKYTEQMGTAYKEAAPEQFSAQKEIDDRLAIQKALGVGRYGEEAQRRIDEREKRYEESKKDRGETRLDTMLDAIIRPGYRLGEASQARSKKIEEFKAADKEFAESQDVLKDAKAKYEEALATGNANAVLKRRDELDKAQQDYKTKKVDMLNEQAKLENTATSNALQSATQLTTTGMSNLTSLQVANIQAAATRLRLTTTESGRVGTEYRRILQAGGQKAAEAFLADEAKVRAAVGGVKYEGQDTSIKDSKAVQDAIAKRTANIDMSLQNPNLKPEKREKFLELRRQIEKEVRSSMGVEGGGGGGAKVVTEADIQATMRNSGKTRAEIVQAAKDRGYTIQ
jgi:hypothetical protein